MKKKFIISLFLIACIELVSCARGHLQGDILYPDPISGRPGSTGRILIEGINEKEIVFKIWISLGKGMWLEYLIVDEEGNPISEESFYHEVRTGYTRKLKAKAEFTFRKGEEYTLYIGYKLPISHPAYERYQLFYTYKFVL